VKQFIAKQTSHSRLFGGGDYVLTESQLNVLIEYAYAAGGIHGSQRAVECAVNAMDTVLSAPLPDHQNQLQELSQ